MKTLTLITLLLLLASCAPRGGYATAADVATDTLPIAEPFDTLARYRKFPGEPKDNPVQGYYRKDSTYVKPHKRSDRSRRNKEKRKLKK